MKTEREWFIQVPWGRMALKSHGHPDGEPVFLVHGRQDSLSVFQPLIEIMSEQYYYVSLDMPGNGLSDAFPHVTDVPLRRHELSYFEVFRKIPRPKRPFIDHNKFSQGLVYKGKEHGGGPKLQRFHFLYAMELALLHLGWDKFIFIGHSMGCEQGLFYNVIYPNRISKMILFDAGPTLMRMQVEDNAEYQKLFFDPYYENYMDENFSRKMYTKKMAEQATMRVRDLTEEQCDLILSRNFKLLEVKNESKSAKRGQNAKMAQIADLAQNAKNRRIAENSKLQDEQAAQERAFESLFRTQYAISTGTDNFDRGPYLAHFVEISRMDRERRGRISEERRVAEEVQKIEQARIAEEAQIAHQARRIANQAQNANQAPNAIEAQDENQPHVANQAENASQALDANQAQNVDEARSLGEASKADELGEASNANEAQHADEARKPDEAENKAEPVDPHGPEGLLRLLDRMRREEPNGYLSWDKRLRNLAPQNYGNDYYFELFKKIPPTLLIAASDGAKNVPPIPKWRQGAKELLDKMATLENFHRVDIEGSHDVHFTHPERVLPYVNAFLKDHKVSSKL